MPSDFWSDVDDDVLQIVYDNIIETHRNQPIGDDAIPFDKDNNQIKKGDWFYAYGGYVRVVDIREVTRGYVPLLIWRGDECGDGGTETILDWTATRSEAFRAVALPPTSTILQFDSFYAQQESIIESVKQVVDSLSRTEQGERNV